MADLKAKVTVVNDGQGRLALYIDESIGQEAIVSSFAPRFQRLAVHGEPCTVFFDKDARSFYIGPVFYKQEFMDRPGRYDHIMDLDWLPNARPDGQAGQAGQAGIAGPTSPAASGGKTEKASRPPTAWTAFMQEKLHEMREENPNVAFGEVSKEASREWKVASDKDKNFFKEVAKYWAGGADEADEADDADED